LHEVLSMGLRPAVGIERTRIELLMDKPISDETLSYLRNGGWLAPDPDRLALTTSGRLLADRIVLELLS
jgi:coproporphyrinogen III oxidase-like Fe-S oxidoreductase